MCTDSTEHMKIAASQELQQAIRIRRVSLVLLEYLGSSIRWLLHYARRNNLTLPDLDKIEESLDKAEDIDEKVQV
jgi:hypothetical protein